MDILRDGIFTVFYSGESHQQAERLLALTKASYSVFTKLFNADHDIGFDIYWADKADWAQVKPDRHRRHSGMPPMTQGVNQTHAVIFPAANIDPPAALSELFRELLDPQFLTSDEITAMKKWLGMQREASDRALVQYLLSSAFSVDLLIEIVHVHELMHDFCHEFGIPENYGRDGRKAWWLFEGLVQWAVLWVQRALGNEKWVNIHTLLYRWFYRTGKGQPGNVSLAEYPNYAWFHGAFVVDFTITDRVLDPAYVSLRVVNPPRQPYP